MGHAPVSRIGNICTTMCLGLLMAMYSGCAPQHPSSGSGSIKTSLNSNILAESREIWVRLPAGYEESEKSYPVLYVLDAEWIFGFAVSSLEFLSGAMAGRMPEMIVVGIPNTDRVRDLTVSSDTTAGYVNFLGFVENELIPYIDGAYRTHPHRVLYGWSSASNVCLWTFFTKPHLFQGYIASGTGISERTREFAAGKISAHSYAWKGLFACAEGDSPTRREGLQRLTTLLEESTPPGLKWECQIMERDDHTTVLPKGLLAGLEFLYAEYSLPTDIAAQGRSQIRTYYRDLSESYGFTVSLSEGAASDAAVGLIRLGKINEAIELFKIGVVEHPESASLQASLGEVYEMVDMLTHAAESYRVAVEIGRRTQDLSLPNYESSLRRIQKKLEEL